MGWNYGEHLYFISLLRDETKMDITFRMEICANLMSKHSHELV